jgi:hypothetical protein
MLNAGERFEELVQREGRDTERSSVHSSSHIGTPQQELDRRQWKVNEREKQRKMLN